MRQQQQQQRQQEQRPQEQANAASAGAAWSAAEEAANRRHDSRARQAGPSQEAPQLLDASSHDGPQRETEQPALSGTALGNGAVLDTSLAQPPTTVSWQAGRADTALAGGGQPAQPGAAAAVGGDGVPQLAASTAEPSSNLHSPVGTLSAEAASLQQCPAPGSSADMSEDRPANAARQDQQLAASDQQTTALHQPVAPLTHHVDQQQAEANCEPERRFLPQQQAAAVEQLGNEPTQLAASFRQQAGAAQPDTTGAAAEAIVPDEQAVRRQQEQVVMPPQQVVPQEQPETLLDQPAVPLEQPALPIEQQALPLEQALAFGGPQQRPAALNDEPMVFEELIGLRGPIRLLFENAATVIFSSAMFMAAALWAPFTWGRITIRGIAMAQTAWKLTVLPAAAMQLLLKNYQVWSQAACSIALPTCLVPEKARMLFGSLGFTTIMGLFISNLASRKSAGCILLHDGFQACLPHAAANFSTRKSYQPDTALLDFQAHALPHDVGFVFSHKHPFHEPPSHLCSVLKQHNSTLAVTDHGMICIITSICFMF